MYVSIYFALCMYCTCDYYILHQIVTLPKHEIPSYLHICPLIKLAYLEDFTLRGARRENIQGYVEGKIVRLQYSNVMYVTNQEQNFLRARMRGLGITKPCFGTSSRKAQTPQSEESANL